LLPLISKRCGFLRPGAKREPIDGCRWRRSRSAAATRRVVDVDGARVFEPGSGRSVMKVFHEAADLGDLATRVPRESSECDAMSPMRARARLGLLEAPHARELRGRRSVLQVDAAVVAMVPRRPFCDELLPSATAARAGKLWQSMCNTPRA